MVRHDESPPSIAGSAVSGPVDDGKPKRGRGNLWRWMAAAAVVAAIAVAVLPQFSTLQPNYYRRYPGLAERMDNWTTSTHSRITCIECHVEPGLNGLVSYGWRSIPAFYSQLAQGTKETNLLGAPSKDACQKCHTIYRTVAPSGDLLIPHRAHVDVLEMECVTCHESLVHSPNRRGFNRPEMEVCLELCHDGDKASNKCVDCHTRKHTPKSHSTADWPKVHGQMAESEDCGQCHDWTPDYCADCHAKRPTSHVGNWKKGHAPHAKTRGDGCLVCHGEEFCGECH